MPLSDLRESLDAPVLTLPIGGKTYIVKACSAAVWLQLQEINDRTAKALEAAKAAGEDGESVDSGVSELDLMKMSLGATYDTMVNSGDVTMPEMKHAGITAYYWQLGQRTVAEAVWESVGKAPAPTTKAPAKSSTRTSTASATTTRRRASTSGTSSPKKSPAPRRR